MRDEKIIDRLIALRMSYKIRIEEEDLEAIDRAIEILKNQQSIVDKLEDIKPEIEELKPNNPNFKYYGVETRTINNVLDILNKRIAELKGENK